MSVLIGFGIKKYLAFLMFRDSLILASTWLLVNAYFYGCIRDLHRLQTYLDLEELKHFWDHCHMKEIGEVLIRVFYFIRNQASAVALKVSLIWEFSRSKVYIKIDITIKIDNNAQA